MQNPTSSSRVRGSSSSGASAHEHADEVVSRVCPPVLDDLDEELEHLLGGDLEPFSIRGEAERCDGGVGPVLELLASRSAGMPSISAMTVTAMGT